MSSSVTNGHHNNHNHNAIYTSILNPDSLSEGPKKNKCCKGLYFDTPFPIC